MLGLGYTYNNIYITLFGTRFILESVVENYVRQNATCIPLHKYFNKFHKTTEIQKDFQFTQSQTQL